VIIELISQEPSEPYSTVTLNLEEVPGETLPFCNTKPLLPQTIPVSLETSLFPIFTPVAQRITQNSNRVPPAIDERDS
jgi:hypothetical protein